MTKKKRKLGLNNTEKAMYSKLVPLVKKLVLENPSNTDNYGRMNRVQITWTKDFPKPKSFPVGKLISDIDGRRTQEYFAAKCLDWLFDMGLTRDTPTAIYKSRAGALISLAKLENSIFNFDDKMLDDLMRMPQNMVSDETHDKQGE